MTNYENKYLNKTVFVLAELELDMETQNDTALSIIGVFSSYDVASKVKDEIVYKKNAKVNCHQSNYEINNESYCFEIIGTEGYFYQLLIVEQEIANNI